MKLFQFSFILIGGFLFQNICIGQSYLDTMSHFNPTTGVLTTSIYKVYPDQYVISMDTTEIIDPKTYESTIQVEKNKIFKTELIKEYAEEVPTTTDTVILIDPKTYKEEKRIVKKRVK